MARRKLPLDQKLREWMRGAVKGQQLLLGDELEKHGVVTERRGQSWVSKYINNKEAAAALDHLVVIAAFFEMTLTELVVAIGAPEIPVRATPRLDTAAVVRHLGELEERLQAIRASIQQPPQSDVSARAPTKAGNTTPGSGPHRPGTKNKGR